MATSPVILIHVIAAIGALIFGGFTLALKKGTATHRLFGRIWVVLLVTTALVSFGIQRSGHFSAIHLLSIIALLGVSASLYAAIRGRIHAHRRGMTAVYVSLAVAGIFALRPGRLLGDLVWHSVGLI